MKLTSVAQPALVYVAYVVLGGNVGLRYNITYANRPVNNLPVSVHRATEMKTSHRSEK